MLSLLSALLVAGAVIKAALLMSDAVRTSRAEATRTRAAELLATFAPGVGAAEQDVHALLVWEPLARTARKMFPDEFVLLDQAAGERFPFSKERVQAAHARWTAAWLAWEHTHDAEYKSKAAAVEHEIAASGGAPMYRAKLDAVEREKLDRYQRRYEEYIRVAKALQALTGS